MRMVYLPAFGWCGIGCSASVGDVLHQAIRWAAKNQAKNSTYRVLKKQAKPNYKAIYRGYPP